LLPGTAKVIASREYEDANLRPRLVVSYFVPTPGDTNGDGNVDLVDLNNVRNHFGESGSPVAGDTAPFDGSVDLIDLNNVRNHFGASASRNAPEPSTVVLVSVALACIVATRKDASVT
jgi:hypothetical protein